jgi:hypothetical protein
MGYFINKQLKISIQMNIYYLIIIMVIAIITVGREHKHTTGKHGTQ